MQVPARRRTSSEEIREGLAEAWGTVLEKGV
jgi:hypothetical protein